MSKNKVTYPVHKMGKFCGYEEYEDGSIEIAASHYQKIDDAAIQEKAVDALLATVVEQCQKLFVPIVETKRRFWEGVAEDYSLDKDKYEYTYYPETKIISREERDKEAKPCG